MKFKPGDKVRLKQNLRAIDDWGHAWSLNQGRLMTIKKRSWGGEGWTMKEDSNFWYKETHFVLDGIGINVEDILCEL